MEPSMKNLIVFKDFICLGSDGAAEDMLNDPSLLLNGKVTQLICLDGGDSTHVSQVELISRVSHRGFE